MVILSDITRNKNNRLGIILAMKFATICLFSFLLLACSQTAESQRLHEGTRSKGKKGATPVLLELFTAEGCSSCPPAESLLAKLQKEQPFRGAEIITMALHVDYWDEYGWKDRYASPLYTARQRIYERKFRTGKIYTPQMVVDGKSEFVGSDLEEAEKAIRKAVKRKKAKIGLAVNEDRLKVSVRGIPVKHTGSTVYMAIAEDDLSSDVTRGENAGRNLTHLSVVRKLQALGRVEEKNTEFKGDFSLQISPEWKKGNLNLIVFLQENQTRAVLGVERYEFPSEKAVN